VRIKHGPVVSSLLTYVETRSVLARKYHSGEIAAASFAAGQTAFEADWRIFTKVPPDSAIVRRAGDLAEQFRLRAYDAIHLANAERIFRETRSQVRFACFDVALNRTASTLGLMPVAGRFRRIDSILPQTKCGAVSDVD
jgi:predicted nucleic acid-binding protein